jgi:hypothetical protein
MLLLQEKIVVLFRDLINFIVRKHIFEIILKSIFQKKNLEKRKRK